MATATVTVEWHGNVMLETRHDCGLSLSTVFTTTVLEAYPVAAE